jgi:hypothetical protein
LTGVSVDPDVERRFGNVEQDVKDLRRILLETRDVSNESKTKLGYVEEAVRGLRESLTSESSQFRDFRQEVRDREQLEAGEAGHKEQSWTRTLRVVGVVGGVIGVISTILVILNNIGAT